MGLIPLLVALFGNFQFNVIGAQEPVPIFFREYGIIIEKPLVVGDTLRYTKSSKETFKIVFEDTRGRCYFEKYLNGKIYQRGNFENSLDTLKRYVSGRDLNGRTAPFRVKKFFEPLKNGEWIIYNKGKATKERYVLGILQ